MRFSVLGPLQVLDGERRAVDLGGRQPRLMLAMLLVADGHSVSVDSLIEALWGEDPPASAMGTLQSNVSRLRRRLGTDTVVLDAHGYRLRVDPADVDHRRFEQLADEGRAVLDSGDARAARQRLVDAESLWRGPALVEFPDAEFAANAVARLEERRLAVVEDRLQADLALGHHAAVVSEVQGLVSRFPLRERLREQQALALYRSGRQAEALRSLADAGATLREELGIEPSRALRDLESGILEHDPALDPPVRSPMAPTEAAADGATSTTSRRGPERPVLATTDLAGREVELTTLLAAFADAHRDAQFVVIEGEPGIGKTRLAEELRHRVAAGGEGSIAVWGRSDEGGAAPALWPWLAPLRELAGHGVEIPPALGELLAGQVVMEPGQAQAAQFQRFDAFADLLEAAGRDRPVVILLDDLQWADDASLDLLGFLAGRLRRGALVVGTVRQLEVGRNDAVTEALAAIARRPGSRRLALRGLDEAATAEVLQAAVDDGLDPGRAERIHLRAEGNPFYAIELARLLDEQGAESDVPGTVRDVIRRRMQRLAGPTVDLLAVAAVVGRDVDLLLLAEAAGLDPSESLDLIEPAIVHRLLVEVPGRPDVLRFSHALVREVLLDDLTAVRRTRLHLRVADAIEARGALVDDVEILAEHLWQASSLGQAPRAADALEAAADVAVRRVAFVSAENLLRRAVELRRASSTDRAGQLAELHTLVKMLEVARARRYFLSATSPAVMERAKELAEAVDDRETLMNLLWFESAGQQTAADLARATPLVARFASMTAEDPRPDIQSLGIGLTGVDAWGHGRVTEANEILQRAMQLVADAPPTNIALEDEQRFVMRCFWDFYRALHGDASLTEVFADYSMMYDLAADRFAETSVAAFAATAALTLGDWAWTRHFNDLVQRSDPDGQFAFWNGNALMTRGALAALSGDLERAIADFEQGRDTYTDVGGHSGQPMFAASLAMNLAVHGATEEAARYVAEARAVLEARGEQWNAPIVVLAEGVLADELGDRPGAAASLASAVAVAREQGSFALVDRVNRIAAERGVALDDAGAGV